MALPKPSPGLLPAENYSRFGAAFDAIDANAAAIASAVAQISGKQNAFDLAGLLSTISSLATQAALANEAALRSGGDAAEAQARQAAIASAVAATTAESESRDTALGKRITDEAQSRSAAIDTLAAELLEQGRAQSERSDLVATVLGSALLEEPEVIGDNPFLFTTALAGAASAVPPLPNTGATTTLIGRVYRVEGAQVIASRRTVPAVTGRVRSVQYGYRRFSAPSDPSNDTIRCGIAWLDANDRLLSTAIVRDDNAPVVAQGLNFVTVRVPSLPGDAIQVLPPAGCVRWRPFIQTFGLDGWTDAAWIRITDVTDAGSYSPDISQIQADIASLQSAVAGLSPLAAGTANGLATLDATGTVVQLPMLKAAWLIAAEDFVPEAAALMDNAVSLPGVPPGVRTSHALNPWVRAGDAWEIFAQATLGLATEQVEAIRDAIGSPSQASYEARPKVIYDLDTTTSSVLRAANARFATIQRASMKDFFAQRVGDEDSDSYYVARVAPHAPIGGDLYNLLLQYLTTPDPAPGLQQNDAVAALTAIWNAAITFRN